MPSGDRTGPMGQGSRTGKSLGLCTGYDTPGFTKGFGGGMGRGFGAGRGRGRGMGFGKSRNAFWPFAGIYQGFSQPQNFTKDDEINLLKTQAESLKKSQKEIEKRISELEKNVD